MIYLHVHCDAIWLKCSAATHRLLAWWLDPSLLQPTGQSIFGKRLNPKNPPDGLSSGCECLKILVKQVDHNQLLCHRGVDGQM